MQSLGIYRLVPIASPKDSAWDLAPNQGEVVVRAFSAADARLVAAEAEADFTSIAAMPGDGVSTAPASAFRTTALYAVREETGGRYPAAGERGVIAGTIDWRVIRPLARG